MVTMVDRAGWRARDPQGVTPLRARPAGVKVHYLGGHVEPGIIRDHRVCVRLVRSVQVNHMDTRLWADIGYTALACPHSQVFVGRGPGAVCAANGRALNARHYAVAALLGQTGSREPTDGLLVGLCDAIDWLRGLPEGQMPAGFEVLGHRDGYATDCPGDPLYAWVKAGAIRPGTVPPPSDLPPWPGRVLKYPPVMSGGDVTEWQARMRERGWDLEVDGLYGLASRLVCLEFQRRKGLRVDGAVGRRTWEAAWGLPVT